MMAQEKDLLASLEPMVAGVARLPWSVRPEDGKPTIASHKGGNLFRGYIATWQEANLIVALVNGLPEIIAALTAQADPTGDDGELQSRLEAIREVVSAAYYACEDSEDDGTENIHVMRSSFERLSVALDRIDGMMPDQVQPALPAVLVSLVMEGLATHPRPDAAQAQSGEVYYRDDEPLTAADQARVDAAWEKYKAAHPAPASDAGEARALAKDFRQRAALCRTNLDAYDEKAASVWDFAAEAAEAML